MMKISRNTETHHKNALPKFCPEVNSSLILSVNYVWFQMKTFNDKMLENRLLPIDERLLYCDEW
jgi:hypothetical protein